MYEFLKRFSFPIPVLLIFLSFPAFASAQQSAMNYFVDGVEAFEAASYQEAIRSLEKAIELDPANLEFQYYLGLTYSAMKQYEDALKVFESIVGKEPVRFRKAYFEIAALYAKQGQYQKAIDTLSIVEKIAPEEVRVYLEKGYAYQRIKDYDQAIENFNKAKDLEPKMLQMIEYTIAAVYFEAEAFDKAEEMFTKAIEVDPTTATAENARKAIVNVRGAKRARRPLYLSASLTWAYDDNVLLKPLEQATVVSATGEALDEDDQFQAFLFRGGYKFVNRKDLEVGAGYSLSCIGYKELVQNNVLGHIPHLYLGYTEHPFYLRVNYDFSYYYTGGKKDGQDEGFFFTFGDRSKKLKMHTIMPVFTIVEPHNLRSEITVSYQKKNYVDEVTSDASHYSAGIVQSYKIPDTEYHPRAGYKYGCEDATDEKSSYKYHQVLLGFSSPLPWGVWGDISVTFERTYFKWNPAFSLIKERRDRKYIGAISLTRPLTEMLQLMFSYTYTNNNSNVSDGEKDPFKFKKNVYSLMLTGMF
jgi:tetratricopeptide (TPR) repeat protein